MGAGIALIQNFGKIPVLSIAVKREGKSEAHQSSSHFNKSGGMASGLAAFQAFNWVIRSLVSSMVTGGQTGRSERAKSLEDLTAISLSKCIGPIFVEILWLGLVLPAWRSLPQWPKKFVVFLGHCLLELVPLLQNKFLHYFFYTIP